MVNVVAESAGAGNRKLSWPLFKPVSKDPILGIKELTPEQTLIEFICTSASLHGVRRQSIRQLECDILQVFPYNIMPANAAAWYMAKRKYYANQPQDNQLLPFIIKKYPEKFRINGYQVEFLEKYNKQVARHKLNYLVHYGLNAYFSHKVDEFGVYFFDPNYYEKTEPFHSSLQLCARGRRVNMLGHYFGWNEGFIYKQHSASLASITRNQNIKVLTNGIGVIMSVAKNGQYGFLKFGSGDKAIFSTKAVFKDGYPFNGDPLRLPAIYFDAYQIPEGVRAGEGLCTWFAVAVWIGKRPAAKFYSTLADFRLTPASLSQAESSGNYGKHPQSAEGRRLRQPSSSMMIGQVVEIRRNGAVVSVRDDSKEKVFIPGWSKHSNAKRGTWLTTLTGDSIGMRDLIAYYLDTNLTMQGFTAVGKNIMVLKEYEEVENTRRRRSEASLSLSSGARYDTETGMSTSEYEEVSDAASTTDESEGEEVSEGELEWLQKDVSEMISKEKSSDLVTFLVKTHDHLAELRAAVASQKSPKSTRERKDSGLGSKPTTPVHMKPLQSGKAVSPVTNAFARTKAALASIDEEYRSSEDEDYETGDDLPSFEVAKTTARRRVSKVSTSESVDTVVKKTRSKIEEPARVQPLWVRAISMPEEYDEETGMFLPVDRYYKESRDKDYIPPYGLDREECDDGSYTFQEWSDEEDDEIEEGKEEREEDKEDLDEELKMLLQEAGADLPQDILDGKHRPSAASEASADAAKTETEESSGDSDAAKEEKTEDSAASDTGAKELKERKIWYEGFYLKFIQNLQVDDENEVEDTTEYYPPSVIGDPDMDFDEVDPQGDEFEISQEELEGLKDDMKLDLNKFGNYIPIWVHVDSVKARKEVAKELVAEKQAAEAAKKAAAEAAEAAKKAAEAAKEAATASTEAKDDSSSKKDDTAKETKPLNLEGLEDAAKQVTDDSKPLPQRKLSAKSSPKKKSPKKSEGSSPKKDAEASPKQEAKTTDSPPKKSSSSPQGGAKSPRKSGATTPKKSPAKVAADPE